MWERPEKTEQYLSQNLVYRVWAHQKSNDLCRWIHWTYLSGILKGVRVLIDDDLGQDGDGGATHRLHGLSEDVTNLTHTLGTQHIEGSGGTFQGQFSDLRTISMCQDF